MAKPFQACFEMSIASHLFEDSSRVCEAWLLRHRRATYHTAEGRFTGLWVPFGDVPSPPRSLDDG